MKSSVFRLHGPGLSAVVFLTSLVLLSFALPGWAAGRQVLRGHVPAAVAHSRLAGPLAGDTSLNLAIGMPLRKPAELEAFLQQLYDPSTPLYRQYLTPAQFTERFGPTEQDYQRLVAFAEANGLSVTYKHPNRLVLDVRAPARAIERVFQIHLRVYQHPAEARTFYAPDAEPSVDFALPLLDISGLDTYALPRPKLKRQPVLPLGAVTPKAGSGPGGSYRGYDFRAAYVPGTSLTGAGQSVGLVQFDGFYPNDITTYASQAGLPNVNLVVVPVDGGVSTPGSGNSEVALDIEMVMSMAPGISTIYVYEAPNPSPWVDILGRMANDNLSRQLSCSWGGGSPNASAEQIFRQMAAQGQSFYNASGDSDAFTSAIAFPSESTNITQVGGTTLTTTGPGGAYVSETVWNWGFRSGSYVGSSGGVSTYYGLPVYQQGISMDANQGSTTRRNVPDVALTGDNVYVVYNNGSSGAFGGTSCAAPLWAGFTALINQQAAARGQPPVGFINPAIYAIGKGANFTAAFHDITTGNNFSSKSPTKYAAVPGYDLCAGWGTPNGINFINALTWPILLTNGYGLTAESSLPANGAIDPGETVTVNLALMNLGAVNSSNLVATLQPGGGVVSPGAPQTYGAIAAGGGVASRPFTFTAAGTCGGTVTATLQLQDGDADLGIARFGLQLGREATPLAERFDAVAAPALPAGWSTATSGAQALWATSAGTGDTAPNAAFTAGAGAVGVNELVSPLFSVGSTTAQLSFRNSYDLQNAAGNRTDGGVLEISLGGNAFQDIIAAGGAFLTNGYTGTLSTSRGNPLGGRSAWTGSSGGYVTAVVQLPAAAAGQTVQLKWRCGTDSSGSSVGWYIDGISLTDTGNYVCAVTNDFWFSSFGDGVPDWWRAQYFGTSATTNEASCATCDADGDGFNNLAEFSADTNPTNHASFLGMTEIAVVPGGLRVDWHGGAAARQYLQQRFDLLSTNEDWADVFTNEPPTPVANSLTNALGTNQTQFFRVRAARP